MLTLQKIEIAIAEAERFIKAAKRARDHAGQVEYSGHFENQHFTYGKYAASAKRASLDLSRVLTDIRR